MSPDSAIVRSTTVAEEWNKCCAEMHRYKRLVVSRQSPVRMGSVKPQAVFWSPSPRRFADRDGDVHAEKDAGKSLIGAP